MSAAGWSKSSETVGTVSGPGARGLIETSLRAKRDAGRKLLVPYVTGGLGDDWVETLLAVAAAGADAVEIGIPFSDPVMDGPTIQEASARSLAGGTTPASILDALRGVEVGVPLIAMSAYNVVYRYGHRRFAHDLVASGIMGAILPEIPLEESPPWERAAEDAGVEAILLAAPNTPDDRMAEICRRSHGFVYGISRLGITGERSALASSAVEIGKRLKAHTDKPVIIGFGVSSPAHAIQASAEADGVVVASAMIRLLLDGGGPEDAAAFITTLRDGLDRHFLIDESTDLPADPAHSKET